MLLNAFRASSNGSTLAMLKRITDPMEYARAEIAITANNENLPVALASIGTMTRKPLPKMEASGVAVARKSLALSIRFSCQIGLGDLYTSLSCTLKHTILLLYIIDEVILCMTDYTAILQLPFVSPQL